MKGLKIYDNLVVVIGLGCIVLIGMTAIGDLLRQAKKELEDIKVKLEPPKEGK